MGSSTKTGSRRLPPTFTPVESIINDDRPANVLVNVMGLVIDSQDPIETRGKDYKSTVTVIDKSVEDDYGSSITLHMFAARDELPQFSAGDVVVIRQAKTQHRLNSPTSLILNKFTTVINVFTSSKIPKPPADASLALSATCPKGKPSPSKMEMDYVAWLYHNIDKGRVPVRTEFEQSQAHSRNVRDKFSLLQDINSYKFYDIIANVVKAPFDMGDKVTMWVSDYTENPAFFNHSFSASGLVDDSKGDPYGYGAKSIVQGQQWTGPFGKRSLQITCWDSHATAIRSTDITKGSWVSMRNVQIKYGHNETNLEGFLREDRDRPRIGVFLLDPLEDPDTIDSRLKEAIRRKRDYDRSKREQLKDLSEAAEAGRKRKSALAADDGETGGSKARRRAKRKEKFKGKTTVESVTPSTVEIEQTTMPIVLNPNLNSRVKCENHIKPLSTLSDAMQRVFVETFIAGEQTRLQLPFVNLNYRTNVRVTDFRPTKIEDFAYAKRLRNEFQALSDNEESDLNSDEDDDDSSVSDARREWQWRFFLELEDDEVQNGQEKSRVWVAVSNQEAQCLVNLDASDLRKDPENLESLRQRMFTLWGNLEEIKSKSAAKQARTHRVASRNGPPPDSSDVEDGGDDKAGDQLSNRPFSCCIRQYGVKVTEKDPAKADAGDSRRWQRVFGLFGTKISS